MATTHGTYTHSHQRVSMHCILACTVDPLIGVLWFFKKKKFFNALDSLPIVFNRLFLLSLAVVCECVQHHTTISYVTMNQTQLHSQDIRQQFTDSRGGNFILLLHLSFRAPIERVRVCVRSLGDVIVAISFQQINDFVVQGQFHSYHFRSELMKLLSAKRQ